MALIFSIRSWILVNMHTPNSKSTTKLWDKTSHLNHKRHWSTTNHLGLNQGKLLPLDPCWASLSNVLRVAILGQWLTDHRVYPLIQSLCLQPRWVLIWPSHLWGSSELEPTGAELSFITASLVLAQFSLCSISLPLYSLVPCRQGTEMRAGCLVLHITPWLQFVIFHTRWSLLWNEMSFPKMKRHKSSVINLLVRLLQLSPVEDIWTADWLMPAVGLKHGSLSHNLPYSQPFSGLLKALLTVWNSPFLRGN